MADPFVGEIRAFGFTYPPQDWVLCNGQLLNVQQYQVLYTVIGNTYGGTQNVSFAVPNLMTRAPAGVGAGPGLTPVTLGQSYGAPSVTLTENQIANHDHSAIGYSAPLAGLIGTITAANEAYIARTLGQFDFVPPASPLVEMASMIQPIGDGGPHENRQPYLALNFCICVSGEYPVPGS